MSDINKILVCQLQQNSDEFEPFDNINQVLHIQKKNIFLEYNIKIIQMFLYIIHEIPAFLLLKSVFITVRNNNKKEKKKLVYNSI